MKIILAISLCLVAVALSDACVTPDFAFSGSDILISGKHNLKSSWEECQQSCQAVTNCNYWTWFETSDVSKDYCLLSFESGGLPVPGAISGPKVC